MGLTELVIEVANPSDLNTTEEVRLLVDSGAVYSVIPRRVLERLGIKPHTEQRFRLADGSAIIRERGIAAFKYQGRMGGVDVIFGADTDGLLLGATTLEVLGFGLDPIRKELLELPALM